VERLLFSKVCSCECLLIRLGDDSWLVVLVGLPENNFDLMVGKIGGVEQFHLLFCETICPAFPISLLDPLPMASVIRLRFHRKTLASFFELLTGVDKHHPAAMVGRLLVSQQPDIGEDTGVVEKLFR